MSKLVALPLAASAYVKKQNTAPKTHIVIVGEPTWSPICGMAGGASVLRDLSMQQLPWTATCKHCLKEFHKYLNQETA